MNRLNPTLCTLLTGVLLAATLAGCETRSTGADSGSRAGSPISANGSEHESGARSPIAFGLEVPDDATQLGPLVRFRSQRLIKAYQPELDAALAQQEANQEAEREEAAEAGEPAPTETPTPSTQPGRDTFDLVANPPRPDTTVALIRIESDPAGTFRRMINQVNTVIADADLVTDDIGEYCASSNRRVVSCRVAASGRTANDQEVRIVITVDPGDVPTRTGRAASQSSPIMTVTAQFVGDPRSGQIERDQEPVDVPRTIDGEDVSGLIWPRMDFDAKRVEGMPRTWQLPNWANLLASSPAPPFAATSTDRVRQADELASGFASAVARPRVDVVEELNEITTTYRAQDKDGNLAIAAYVLSARGNYAMLLYSDADAPSPWAFEPK